MNEAHILNIVREELSRLAPEIDFDAADWHQPLQQEFDIDSMDFLNFVTALHERLDVDIQESDYAKVASVAGAMAYLMARARNSDQRQ